MQLPRVARLHAQRALAPDLQRQLDARAAEQVAARRGRGGAASEQLEADRALRRDVVGVLAAHVLPQGFRPSERSGAVAAHVIPPIRKQQTGHGHGQTQVQNATLNAITL